MADTPKFTPRVPAWKKLGLKLKYANDESPAAVTPSSDHAPPSKKRARDEAGSEAATRPPSNHVPGETPSKKSKKRRLEQAEETAEPEQAASTSAKASKKDKKDKKEKKEKNEKKEKKPGKESDDTTVLPDRTAENPDSQEKVEAFSTPVKRLKRKKSVSFTPDTKKSDGDSGQQLFKAWAKTQTGLSSEDAIVPSTESAVEDAEPASHLNESSKKELKKTKKEQRNAAKAAESAKEAKDLPPYVNYLQQYHSDNANWKFNKKHQVDLLKNLFNVYRVPASYDPAVEAYITGLKGANARYLLKQEADKVLEETTKIKSDDTKQHGAKRRRAEQVLKAMGHVEEPPAAVSKKIAPQKEVEAPEDGNKKRSRPRKSRTQDFSSSSEDEDSSSDESSVVSSSSDEPSSDSESDSDSDDSDSSSDDSSSASSSDSDSESEAGDASKEKSARKKKQEDSDDSDNSDNSSDSE